MKRLFIFIFVLVVVIGGLQAQPRITGGFQIDITEAPQQVLVTANDILNWCGGSIIEPN